MNVSPSFFRDPATKRLLDLAATAAAVPVCIHTGDTLRLMGWGRCEACDYANGLPEGKQACHDSRVNAAATARRRQVPVTFVCHMGFTCVIACVLKDTDFTIVLGPYIPAEAADAIDYSVVRGVRALGGSKTHIGTLPFSLDDVRIVPQGAVRAAAEWLLDGLQTRFDAYSLEAVETGPQDEPMASPGVTESSGQREEDMTAPPVDVAIAALAVLCGNTREPRAFLADLFKEAESNRKQPQPRLIRSLSEILDAVQRMGGEIDSAWSAYSRFVEEALIVQTEEELLKQAEKVLRCATRACKSHFSVRSAYMPHVMNEIYQHYASENLLSHSAEVAGVAPSSITRAMEKLTGANFSEVLGRVRIAHARRMLRDTGMTASGIARLVGINDQSNFGKLFLRYTGCTPGTYRARFRKKSISQPPRKPIKPERSQQ